MRNSEYLKTYFYMFLNIRYFILFDLGTDYLLFESFNVNTLKSYADCFFLISQISES